MEPTTTALTVQESTVQPLTPLTSPSAMTEWICRPPEDAARFQLQKVPESERVCKDYGPAHYDDNCAVCGGKACRVIGCTNLGEGDFYGENGTRCVCPQPCTGGFPTDCKRYNPATGEGGDVPYCEAECDINYCVGNINCYKDGGPTNTKCEGRWVPTFADLARWFDYFIGTPVRYSSAENCGYSGADAGGG